MEDFAIPDSGIKECCRALITGSPRANSIIEYSIQYDHVKCFKSLIILTHNREYLDYVRCMKDTKLKSGHDVPDIFKLLVDQTMMTHKTVRACININNMAMLDYLLKKTNFIYIAARFIEILIYENNRDALDCLFRNICVSWYHRDKNIPMICIQTASVDIMRLLFDYGFTMPLESLIFMIRYQRYDMIEFALENPDKFTFDSDVILYTIVVENFDIQAMKMLMNLIALNLDFFLNLLLWHVDFNNIIKLHSAGVIDAVIVNRIFENTVEECIYDKCEMFIRHGYTIPSWMYIVKIVSNDFEFINMVIRVGYYFNEEHINVMVNTQLMSMRLVYTIMNNLHLNSINNIRIMDILVNGFSHNHYIFSRLMRLGMSLNKECINYMIDHSMISYIKITYKHVTTGQINEMMEMALRKKKYSVVIYLAIIKLKRM